MEEQQEDIARIRYRYLTISSMDAVKLVGTKNGDAVLLYLYVFLHDGDVFRGDCTAFLGWPNDRLEAAISVLRDIGILETDGSEPPSDGAGEESSTDEADASKDKPGTGKTAAAEEPDSLLDPEEDDPVGGLSEEEFLQFIETASVVLDRNITPAEQKKITELCRYSKLPLDVALMAFEYAKEVYKASHGDNARVPIYAVEKEVGIWDKAGIVSYEQAEDYIRNCDARKDTIKKLQEMLNLDVLTKTTRDYLDNWLNAGYGIPEIMEAADRTITKLGRLNWGYANGIINSWHKNGCFKLEDIRKFDQAHWAKVNSDKNRENFQRRYGLRGKTTDAPQEKRDDSAALQQMQRLQEKMKAQMQREKEQKSSSQKKDHE